MTAQALVSVDPGVGPLDRLEFVKSNPWTMEAVAQKVIDGWTLKQIARDWGVPVGRFCAWVLEEPGREGAYEAALRIRADELAHETLAVADDEVRAPADKAVMLRARQWLAGKMDPARYGEHSRPRLAARVIVDRTCDAGEKVAVEVAAE